jgi:V/A-type H+-transporting ATPase subunit E
VTQAQELEQAIMARAERLANEYRERAKRSRDAILRDAADKLRLREQREEAIAKALAERTYRQQVQAEELRLQSHLDLVRDVEGRLAEQMQSHAEDDQRQLKTLIGLIGTAAAEIEHAALTVQANAHDRRLLAANWEQVLAALLGGKQVTLAEESIDCLTGVLVTTADGRIRVDNTFDGRMARLRMRIQQRILERLLPSGFDTGSIFTG